MNALALASIIAFIGGCSQAMTETLRARTPPGASKAEDADQETLNEAQGNLPEPTVMPTPEPTSAPITDDGDDDPKTSESPAPTADESAIFLYVSNVGSSGVQRFKVTSKGQDVKALAPFDLGEGRNSIPLLVLDDGKHLAVGAYGAEHAVEIYNVADDTGDLIRQSAASTDGPSSVYLIASPDGKVLYGSNYGENNVSVFVRDAMGAISLKQTIAAGINPHSVAVSADGSEVFVPNKGSDTINVYTADPASQMLALATRLGMPEGFAPRIMKVHPKDATLAVVVGEGGSVATLRIRDDGALEILESLKIGGNGGDIEFAQDGALIYATAREEMVIAAIRLTVATGALSLVNSTPGGGSPNCLALSPDGSFLAVAHWPGDSIAIFPVAADGALGEPKTYPAGKASSCLAQIPIKP